MKVLTTAIAVAVTFAGADRAGGQVLASQTFAVKKCDDPKVPIGRMPVAAGTLTFRLAKDGKPDVTSPAVTKVLGLSVAAFRSAASRLLSDCRFEVAKGAFQDPVIVSAEIAFGPARTDVGPARVTDAGTPLAGETFTPGDTTTFAFDDPRLEERPSQIGGSCGGRASGGPSVIRASGATPAEAKANGQQQIIEAWQQWNATHAGTITAMVRVGPNGKIGSQIQVMESSNPVATQALGDLIGSCKYVPGRVLGVAVSAFAKVTMTMQDAEVHFVP